MSQMIQTPNGVFFIDDNATPDAIARAKADFMARNKTPASSVSATPTAPLTAEQKEVQRRVDEQHALDATPINGIGSIPGSQPYARKFIKGVSLGFMPKAVGAVDAMTSGVANAFRTGDIGQIGKEYTIGRDTERTLENENVPGGTLSEIAGALTNPVGDGATALQALRFIPKAVEAGKVLEAAPGVVRGVAAGANSGALNAVGEDDSGGIGDKLVRAGQGALVGGTFGGALGGSILGLRRGAQILADRTPAAAERVAAGKIGTMLDKAGITPAQAERELAVTNARGGDGRLMDITPGLQAQGAALARRPDVAASNDLIQQGQQRLNARPSRFVETLKQLTQPLNNGDADAHLANITADRKAQGALDYPSVLNKNFVWNDQLEDFVKNAPAPTRKVLKDAVDLVLHERKDPTALGMGFDADGNVQFQKVPSMQSFDYMKRAFDQNIAQAYKAGDNNTARILSGELDTLKAGINKSNPEYQNVLDKQRDFYQRANATELGLNVVKNMRSDPRAVLKEIRGLDPATHDDARQGIIDALIDLHAKQADPVAYFKTLMRTPEQRQIMEFAFNGKGPLGKFERWTNRELRAKTSDNYTAPGRQSITSTVQGADNSLNDGIGGMAVDAGRGFAYGGPAGATAAVFRKFSDLKNGLSHSALEAMAQALMGDGAGLGKSVTEAQAYAKVRKLRNARAAILAAKGGQQPFTDYSGE